MTNSKNLGIGAVALFSLGVVLIVYGYTTSSSNSLARALKIVLPVAWVGNNAVSINDWQENLAIAKRVDPAASRDAVAEKLIWRAKQKIVARELGVDWKDSVARELEYYVSTNAESYPDFLKQYFSGSERLFVKYVIEPSAIDANLRIYFNAKQKSSPEFKKASEILSRSMAGEKFEDLAKQYSEDKATAQFGGDLGFFKPDEILPELAEQIKKGEVGEIQKEIFVSRLGFHLVYPVEAAERDGEKYWHGKHILVTTDGYDEWLDSQMKNIRVRYLVKNMRD